MNCLPRLLLSVLVASTAAPHATADDWHTLTMPDAWRKMPSGELKPIDGFSWYRALVKVPADWKGDRLTLYVEAIDDARATYLNGTRVGATGTFPPQFRSGLGEKGVYKVKSDLLKPGEFNTVAIRVFQNDPRPNFSVAPPVLLNETDMRGIRLNGDWQYRPGDDEANAFATAADFELDPAADLDEAELRKLGGYSKVDMVDDIDLYVTKREGDNDPLSPKQAEQRFETPDDLEVQLVLSEPEIAQPLPPKTYRVPIPVTATAFNADASILASSGYHEILLWKTADGSLVRRITNVAERVYDLEFSADGTQLAVAAGTPGQLGEVKLFSTTDGTHQKTLVRTKDAVFAVSYSPDGKSLAASGADRVVYAVNVATGDTMLQIEDHADWVMDVKWSPDGNQLVTASRAKTSKVFDVASGQSVITFNGHGDAVYSAAFLTDGKSIVSAGSDRQARIWTVADARETRKIGGFGSDIFRVEVTPENHLLTASADRNAREHSLADGKEIRTFAGHKDWVYTLSYNPTKKLIATGSYDGEIRVWNSKDGSVATSFIAIPQAGDSATVAAAEE